MAPKNIRDFQVPERPEVEPKDVNEAFYRIVSKLLRVEMRRMQGELAGQDLFSAWNVQVFESLLSGEQHAWHMATAALKAFLGPNDSPTGETEVPNGA